MIKWALSIWDAPAASRIGISISINLSQIDSFFFEILTNY